MGTVDLSGNPLLTTFYADATDLTSIDFSQNDLLKTIWINGNDLPYVELDKVIIDLDANGAVNGSLKMIGQSTRSTLTYNSLLAYTNLKLKGWTIDVGPPPPINLQTVSFSTTSRSANWTPELSDNWGVTLKWTATGGGIPEQVFVADKPTFNFSANTGVVNITIESTDGFAGFWRLWLNYLDILNLDLSNATAMERLNLRSNANLGTIDLSSFPNLDRLGADATDLFAIDVSNKPKLNHIFLTNNDLSVEQLDQVMVDLDANGTPNGFLNIGNQSTGAILSLAAIEPFNNLKSRGWKFDLPEINVLGQGISIPGDGTNVPNIANDTDFGTTLPGTGITKTYTIQNLGDKDPEGGAGYLGPADLVLTNPSPFITITGPDADDFSVTSIPASTVLAQSSTTFNITFNGSIAGVKIAKIIIKSNDFDELTYTFNIKAVVSSAFNPQLDITGNDISIINSGSPSIANGTDFDVTTIGNPIIKTFKINNIGNGNLEITTPLSSNNPNFQITKQPLSFSILSGASESFEVSFNPNSLGSFNGSILIQNNDPNASFFIMNVSGKAQQLPNNQIMITQYYEGSTNSKWIEVINLSGSTIPAGTYFLAMYDQTKIPNIVTQVPTDFQEIPALAAGQVVLFSNNAATMPAPTFLGVQVGDIIRTSACDFDGDDIILISTMVGSNCYANRVDMIGDLTGSQWGVDTSFIRGGFSNELPESDFNLNSWTKLSIEGEVNEADNRSNIALGTQELGPVSWNGIQWSSLADRTRNVEINGPYEANNGSIVACNLTVNAPLNFDGGTQNHILLSNNLVINEEFLIGDEESLLTLNPEAIITGEIIKTEKSTPLNNLHDVTYWSAPVKNETIGHVFNGVDPNRIFYLNPAMVNPIYAGTIYGHWFIANGGSVMQAGRGYSAEGISAGEQIIRFKGSPNNGDIDMTVNYKGTPDADAENDNFNLVGNPYPSTISVNALLSDPQNGNLEQTIYLWSHNTPVSAGGDYVAADYATYTVGTGGVAAGIGGAIPNGYLASSQGFMLRTTEIGNGLINFKNDHRLVDKDPVFFKSENKKKEERADKDRLWISLKTDQGGFKQILVGFMEGAADNKDAYDGSNLKSNNPISFYSMIDKEKFAIQGLGPFSPEKEVVLGFDTDVAPRRFTMEIDKKEGIFKDQEVYLTDNLLGITHNLSQSTYSFEQTISGEFPNRLTLQFAKNSLDVEEIIQGSEFNVFNSAEGFRINASKVVTEVNVYDMLGRMIMSSKPDQQSFYMNANSLKTGAVLIFEVKLENGTILNKKAIKM